MNVSNNVQQSSSSTTPAGTANSSASLRPRPRRLISGLSEGDETAFEDERNPPRRIASPLPSPFDSRSASPIPSPHPQRSGSSSQYLQNPNAAASWARRAQLGGQSRARNESPSSFAGIWGNPWNTLQGLASEFLGNEQSGTDLRGSNARQRRTVNKGNSTSRSSSTNSRAGQWGPAPTSHPVVGIGTGSKEDREAAVRAEKRKNMLLRGDSSYASTLGKFKRRLSDEGESASAPPGEQDDRSALVYLHHVQKDDTLAGITIKYNISANALRKANRMWPNDTIQSRNTLILPVAACAVKGRPVSSGEAVDLLGTESDALSAGQAEEVETPKASVINGDSWHKRGDSTSTTTTNTKDSSSVAVTSNVDAEPPWHHDSWTLLSGQTKPTEIARLSRRALGYFPPARRKSVSFSDLDTPPRSIDLPRPSSSSEAPHHLSQQQQTSATAAASTSASASASASASGTANPHASPQRNSTTTRPRRLSNADNGYYPSYLAGPGGVGTMNKNVHYPGPAQDGLNKMFAKFLADVAPPKNQSGLAMPDLPVGTTPTTTMGGGNSGIATPVGMPSRSGTSTPGGRTARAGGGGGAGPQNLNLNLETMGGQIESWVRRVATQAKASMASTGDRGAAYGNNGSGGGGSSSGSRSGGVGGGGGSSGGGNGSLYRGPRVSVGTPGKGAGGVGDLIEMTNEFEIGDDDLSSEDDEQSRRGRKGSSVYLGQQKSSSSADYFGGAAMRDRGAPSAGSKRGKAD